MIIFYRRFLVVTCLLSIYACSVYTLDIQQGNVITQEMIEKLNIGMEKGQITRIIGTPLISNPFRSNRWEYLYSMNKNGGNIEQFSHITLEFENSTLSKIQIHKAPLKEAELATMHRESRASKKSFF